MLTPSDELLMEQIRNGDEAAFETLMRRHEDAVFRLAYRMMGRAAEARDAAQEVFLGIWQRPEGYSSTAKFTTWLYRVTANRVLSYLRLQTVKRLISFGGDDTKFDVADDAEGAENGMIRKERESAVEQALLKLPPRQRAAVHLRYREELSVVEVAEALGVSFKSAESLLFRSRESLRIHLKSLA